MEHRVLPKNNNDDNLFMHSMFEEVLKNKGIDGSFNYVEIKGKTALPDDGWTRHEHDEISLVIEGEVESNIDGKISMVKTGDYTLIKKGTPHKSHNLSEKSCKIVCLLI